MYIIYKHTVVPNREYSVFQVDSHLLLLYRKPDAVFVFCSQKQKVCEWKAEIKVY